LGSLRYRELYAKTLTQECPKAKKGETPVAKVVPIRKRAVPMAKRVGLVGLA